MKSVKQLLKPTVAEILGPCALPEIDQKASPEGGDMKPTPIYRGNINNDNDCDNDCDSVYNRAIAITRQDRESDTARALAAPYKRLEDYSDLSWPAQKQMYLIGINGLVRMFGVMPWTK